MAESVEKPSKNQLLSLILAQNAISTETPSQPLSPSSLETDFMAFRKAELVAFVLVHVRSICLESMTHALSVSDLRRPALGNFHVGYRKHSTHYLGNLAF